MCFNAFGLGALNIFWIVNGVCMALLNVLPFSTDCNSAMSSWLGVEHECNSIESFLNLVWCFAIVAWSLTCAVVAALPKLVPTMPASVNKAAMLGITAASLSVNVAYLYIACTMTVEVSEGVTADLMGTMGTMIIVGMVLLVVAAIVHREPSTGEKVMF